jgi:serpin B
VCGHTKIKKVVPVTSYIQPTREKLGPDNNAKLADRIFSLGSSSGCNQPPPSNISIFTSAVTRQNAQTLDNDKIYTMQTGGVSQKIINKEDDPRYVMKMPDFSKRTETEVASSYQFLEKESTEHTNMSGQNLIPSGLTALSIMDDVKRGGAIVGNFSITYLLALLYRCSRGTTEIELRKMLGIGNVTSDTLFKQVQEINKALRKNGMFRSYNALIFSTQPRNSFSRIAGEISVISVENWQTVNSEISSLTNGLIQNVLNEIPTDSFVLVNAVYFKSTWKNAFNIKYTSQETFRGNSIRQVPMMNATNDCNYVSIKDIGRLLELDYADGEFTMGFLLPTSSFTLGQFTQIDSSSLKKQEVHYSIPKFTQRSNVELTSGYTQLGIKQLFNAPELPFIFASTGNSKLFHQAVIIIDELGTEAAAATKMYVTNCVKETPKPIEFKLNIPFYYYIRHRPTDTIVFIGHYV